MNKRLCTLGAALLWCLGTNAFAQVGFTQFDIQTESSGSVPVAIWYPTDAKPSEIRRGPFVFSAAENALPRTGPHPLVIISHGSGSGQLTHMNLAVHLADVGYVVAAVTHARDNFRDETGSGTADVIRSRAKTVSALIDRILAPNPLKLVVDNERIAVAGFSAGGATALALGGAQPSMASAVSHCEAYADSFCRFVDPEDPRFEDATPMSDLGDNRIRSIILMAPVTAYFSDIELATMMVPTFVFAPRQDTELSPEANADRLANAIEADLTFYEEPLAGHFSILPVFPEATWDEVPEALRTDATGFERAAFHQRLFSRIHDFLNGS